MRGPVTVACVQRRARRPRPRRDARPACRADGRGGGERRRARRLPRDLRLRLPELGLGEGARRLGRSACEGGVRRARPVRCRGRAGPRAGRLDEIAQCLALTGVNELDPARNGTVSSSLPRAGRLARARTTASSCRRTTSASSGGRATAAGCARSRLRSAGSAGSSAGRTTCRSRASRSTSRASRSTSPRPLTTRTSGRRRSLHIARESRAFVVSPCHFQRASAYPDDFPLAELLEGRDLGARRKRCPRARRLVLAGPLYDEEGILYAELDPSRLLEERQPSTPPATTTVPTCSASR